MRAVIIKNIITYFNYFSQIFSKGLLYFLLFAISSLFISLISARKSRFCDSILSKDK